MSQPIQLIVGLGNPGEKYAHTRHNAGAWLVQALAQTQNCSLRPEAKFHGLHAALTPDCQLLIPTTYMNKSGLSVKTLASYYKIPSQSILIVHDELDLPPGVARLKFDGGSGGHNGLKDIIDHLQTKQFYRLRLGIGHPGPNRDVADYVLNPPPKAEQEQIQQTLVRSIEVLPALLKGEFQKAMQQLHTDLNL